MTPELPVLGLRVGKEISPVHGRVERRQLLTNPHSYALKERTIEDIWEMLQQHLKIDLLNTLDAFSLDYLNWRQAYHQNALSALFLGSSSQQLLDLNQSTAILEVISAVEEGKIQPQELALSTIKNDSTGVRRIVSVGYNLASHIAQRVGISLASQEIPTVGPYYGYSEDYQRCFRSISKTLNPDYWCVRRAIITPAMNEQVPDQTFILDSGPLYQEEMLFDHPSVKSMGFRSLVLDNTTLLIGRDDKWNIQFPASVVKSN